jgi:stage V sporulation protein SpoVS
MIDSRHSSHPLRTRSPRWRELGAMVVVIAALLFQSPLPAIAAYCGSSADTSALENLAVARGHLATSRIIDIVVVQDYARVDVQFKGRLTEYYVKDCGQWRFSGYTLPTDAPRAVTAQLSSFVTRDDGGTQCINPQFVNHPSGP